MRPLFTIHAGEFLVGAYIERNFPALNIWIPAKDTGVDLLVTGKPTRSPVSLQVKLSRDYKAPEARNDFERMILGAGWLTINHAKCAASNIHALKYSDQQRAALEREASADLPANTFGNLDFAEGPKIEVDPAERVNDFATPGVMNLLCSVRNCVRDISPVVAG